MKQHLLKRACKLVCATMMSIALLCSAVMATEFAEEADGHDTTAPVVNSVTINTTSVEKGGKINLTLDLVEDETGVANASIALYRYTEDGLKTIGATELVTGSNWHTGSQTIEIDVDERAVSGTYYIGELRLKDVAGNETNYFDGWKDSGYQTDETGAYLPVFQGSGKCYINSAATVTVAARAGDDEAAPRMSKVSWDVEKVNNGTNFDITFDLIEDGSGLEDVSFSFYTYDGEELKLMPSAVNYVNKYKTGTYTVSYQVKGAAPGRYYLGEVQLHDAKGNLTDYHAGWRKEGYQTDAYGAYIPSSSYDANRVYIAGQQTFEVVASGDVTAPIVSSVKLVTSEVIKPDVIKVQMDIKEADALASASISLYTYVNNKMYTCDVIHYFDTNAKTGVYEIEVPATTDTVSGKYYFGEVRVTDKAGNSVNYFDGWQQSGYLKDDKGYYLPVFGNAAKRMYIANGATAMVKDEFEVAFELGLSNPNLLSKVRLLNVGQTGQILIDNQKVVKSEIFDAIKGKDITLAFFTKDYRWVFNGKDIANSKEVELTVSMEETTEEVNGNNHSALKVQFPENGQLPGKASVRVRSDFFRKMKGHGMNLYYWDPKSQSLTLEKNGNVKAKGAGDDFWGSFEIEHNSTFMVVDEGSEADAQRAQEKQKEQQEKVNKINAFVSRMYTVALSRDAEAAGLNDWSNRLQKQEIDGAGIAQGFIGSAEFTNRNLSNEDFINTLYRTFFNREPDAEGKADWMQRLSGGAKRMEVLSGFVNSVEFANLCDSFGIARGTMQADGSSIYKAGVRNYVLRMYTKALSRGGETVGVEDWTNRINTKAMSAEDVAKSFFASQEFVNRNLSNEDYVETLYQTFMDRASDAGGKADWVNRLNGGVSRTEVLEGFSRSAEFGNIMASYGL